jgi:hypothetical protein
VTRRALCLVLATAGLWACSEKPAKPGRVSRAEFGIFFGGQVQERESIPFTVDRGKQLQGFRIEFREPLDRPAKLRWEIDRPRSKRRGRLVELGRADARVGLDRFDQELPFSPGDVLGTWNIRVLVDDQIVIDRPFEVYDRDARRRARAEAEARMVPPPAMKAR